MTPLTLILTSPKYKDVLLPVQQLQCRGKEMPSVFQPINLASTAHTEKE